MYNIKIETNRLILRRFEENDIEAMYMRKMMTAMILGMHFAKNTGIKVLSVRQVMLLSNCLEKKEYLILQRHMTKTIPEAGRL